MSQCGAARVQLKVSGNYCSLPTSLKLKVAQSFLTLCNPMDYSPPGSSIHGILQARILEWAAVLFSRGSSRPGIEPKSPALQADSLPSELPGKPFFPESNPQTVTDKSWWINTPVSSPFRWDRAEACPEWLSEFANRTEPCTTPLLIFFPSLAHSPIHVSRNYFFNQLICAKILSSE